MRSSPVQISVGEYFIIKKIHDVFYDYVVTIA